MNQSLIVVGGGEHARVVMEAARLSGWRVLGYVGPEPDTLTDSAVGCRHLGRDEDLAELLKAHGFPQLVLGVGGPLSVRDRLRVEISQLDGARWARIIHPQAIVAEAAEVGEGAFVGAGAIVQTCAALGAHAIVNTQAVVEHDVQLGVNSHVGPGAIVGGGVIVGDRSFVGMGAKVRDHLKIGAGVTIGAGAVVVSPVKDAETVAGVPAVSIRDRREINLDAICVPLEASLYDVMAVISREGTLIALVVDDDRCLMGVVTDGDIRRALLDSQSFDRPVRDFMNKNYRAVSDSIGRAAAVDMMRAHAVSHLPVLDKDRRIVGLHFLGGWLGRERSDVIAVVMAGGKGTRLRPLTENVPKPMLRVAGRPILEHIVWHLSASRISTVFIAINYLGAQIESHFGGGTAFGCRIRYLKEKERLGTCGALGLLDVQCVQDKDILLQNGDLMTQFDVDAFVDFHQRGAYDLTIGVRDHFVDVPYGVVQTNDVGDRLVGIVEKPRHSYLVNAGVYMLSGSLLDRIPHGKEYNITDLIDELLQRDRPVGVYSLDGDWVDVGQHGDLKRARGGE